MGGDAIGIGAVTFASCDLTLTVTFGPQTNAAPGFVNVIMRTKFGDPQL